MTRIEHIVSPAADVHVEPTFHRGGHAVTVEDGDVTLVLQFGSIRLLIRFVAAVSTYLIGVSERGAEESRGAVELASTGVWDQGPAGQPVGESGEAGNVATTRALPADPDTSVAWGSRTPRYPFVEGFNPAAPADPPTWPRDGI